MEGTTATISKATESLMAKINQRRASKRIHGDDRSEKMLGNCNALKMDCTFQMGLFEELGSSCIQVKEKRGGGIRHLKALKTTTMAQLGETGKEVFFSPNRKCKIGNANEFEFTMRDFTEDQLDPLTTLAQQYEKRKVKLLRPYPSCKKIDTDADETLNAATLPGESQNAPALTSESRCAAAASHGAVSIIGSPSETAFTTGTPSTSEFVSPMSSEILNAVAYVSTENDMLDKKGLIVVPKESFLIDEEIVLGYAFLDAFQDDIDDTLPVDPVQEESSLQDQNIVKTTRLRLRR